MKEQIKEIARVLCEKYDTEHCKVCDHNGRCMVRLEAEWIYEAGYRKQSDGEWKWISDDDVICSACGKVFYTADNADAGLSIWSFCPNCGAKMKGGE